MTWLLIRKSKYADRLREKIASCKRTHDQGWQQMENKHLWRTYLPDSALSTGVRRQKYDFNILENQYIIKITVKEIYRHYMGVKSNKRHNHNLVQK